MKSFLHSILFALRISAKSPLNTVLSILVLSGGIALTTSMFRLGHMVTASSLPYRDSNNIVVPGYEVKGGGTSNRWGLQCVQELSGEMDELFDGHISMFMDYLAVSNGDLGGSWHGAYVSWDFLPVLGREPVMGRSFTEEDARADANPVVIINETVWNALGGGPDIIGQVINVDGIQRTVIGIMPSEFKFPFSFNFLWIPLNLDTIQAQTGWAESLLFFAYLRKDMSFEVSNERFAALAEKIVEKHPDEISDFSEGRLRKIKDLMFSTEEKLMILSIFACSVMVLLMGCGLVSGLMTARYSARAQEIAIRSAMGASRWQIIRQMMSEFMLVAIGSTALGFLLHKWLEAALLNPYYEKFELPSYLLKTSALSTGILITCTILGITLFSTLMPALRASKADVGKVLKESTRTSSSLRVTRLSNIIIVWQVATAFAVLCVGIGTILHMNETRAFKGHYNPAEFTTGSIGFDAKNHRDDAERGRLCNRIVAALNANPQIEAAGVSSEFLSGSSMGAPTRIWIDGQSYASDMDVPVETSRVISPGYFRALDIPVISGREFTDQDDKGHPPVIIVTDAFARKYFGSTDVLGKKVRFDDPDAWYSIVGIVPDIYALDRTTDGPETGFFVPFALQPWFDIVVFARAHGGTAEVERLIRKTMGEVDSDVSMAEVAPMNEVRNRCKGIDFMEFLAAIFMTLAAGALVMSVAGLYGIISFSVNMRRLEMGIRMALGASPSQLVKIVTRRGFILVLIGMLIGIPGSNLLAWLIGGREFSGNLTPGLLSAGIICPICLIAVMVPALLAVASDPSKSLREE